MKINLIKKQTDMSDIEKGLFLEEEKALIDAFELEELEKRYEMSWIRVSAVGSTTGTNVGGPDHGTIGPMVNVDPRTGVCSYGDSWAR